MKDPLKILLKSTKEIKALGLKPIVIPNRKGLGRGTWKRKKPSGDYAIICNNMIIDGRFDSSKEAREFGVWNYKGRRDFRVVNLREYQTN